MQRESRAALEKVVELARIVEARCSGLAFSAYEADPDLQAIVERHLITIGEALSRVARKDPELFAAIPEAREVVAFRHVLVHGYDAIDQGIVWDALTEDLQILVAAILDLLAGASGEGDRSE